MGNFLQRARGAAVAAAHLRARLDAAGGTLADSAHDQGMSAHTMQSTLRLLIVGQAPIEPWKTSASRRAASRGRRHYEA